MWKVFRIVAEFGQGIVFRMFRRVFEIARPVALALAIFIFMNLLLALQNSQSSATRLWLNISLPEPALSIFAGVLGLAILLPHELSKYSWLRWILAGVVFGFCILVGANVIGYYHRLNIGSFRSDLPLPFSALILTILLSEFGRISLWGPVQPRLPLPAWVFVRGGLIVSSFFFLISVHIVTYGHTDYRRSSDAAVILGAKVRDDGTLSPALEKRVRTGVQLYEQKLVSYLIMTGGMGPNGFDETEVMAFHAQRLGVSPDHIILDRDGSNTLESARNCGLIARQYGFDSLLTVSQDFHCARIKMVFEREGAACYTVPARVEGEKVSVLPAGFPLLREIFAFPFYLLYYG